MFSLRPTLLERRIFLGSRFPHVIFPWILADKDYAHVAHPYQKISIWRTWRRVLFPTFQFTWNRFSRWESWETQPNYGLLQYRNCSFSFAPPFFDFLLGFPSASTCRQWHLSPFSHPCSDLQVWHTGGCQKLHDGFFNNFIAWFL